MRGGEFCPAAGGTAAPPGSSDRHRGRSRACFGWYADPCPYTLCICCCRRVVCGTCSCGHLHAAQPGIKASSILCSSTQQAQMLSAVRHGSLMAKLHGDLHVWRQHHSWLSASQSPCFQCVPRLCVWEQATQRRPWRSGCSRASGNTPSRQLPTWGLTSCLTSVSGAFSCVMSLACKCRLDLHHTGRTDKLAGTPPVCSHCCDAHLAFQTCMAAHLNKSM